MQPRVEPGHHHIEGSESKELRWSDGLSPDFAVLSVNSASVNVLAMSIIGMRHLVKCIPQKTCSVKERWNHNLHFT